MLAGRADGHLARSVTACVSRMPMLAILPISLEGARCRCSLDGPLHAVSNGIHALSGSAYLPQSTLYRFDRKTCSRSWRRRAMLSSSEAEVPTDPATEGGGETGFSGIFGSGEVGGLCWSAVKTKMKVKWGNFKGVVVVFTRLRGCCSAIPLIPVTIACLLGNRSGVRQQRLRKCRDCPQS